MGYNDEMTMLIELVCYRYVMWVDVRVCALWHHDHLEAFRMRSRHLNLFTKARLQHSKNRPEANAPEMSHTYTDTHTDTPESTHALSQDAACHGDKG